MKNLKQKKGFLLAEETLKIILAIIAIGFLAYLLFSLYQANKGAEELDLAKESLNFLFQQINDKKTSVDIYNPDGWYINSWQNSYETGFLFWKSTASGKPLSCSNLGWNSCICICEENNPDSCDSDGTCLENTGNFVFDNVIVIKNPPVKLVIDYSNKKIFKE
ncbi:MAG: hypothetical protein ABIH65_02170 [Nanoarchaeota archaeon]